MNVKKAAVIGAGTMGAQIAQTISLADIPVILMDLDEKGVRHGLETVGKIYQTSVERGKIKPADAARKTALVSGTTTYEDFKDIDLVVEAIFEDMNTKRKVFEALDAICPPRTVLASNTSSLSISAIASGTGRPTQVIGMHFFNPVYAMKLVEVIPGLDTAPNIVSESIIFSKRLGKTPIKVRECPGFVVNRLLIPYLNEALLVLEQGMTPAREIDEAMKAFGMPMGPLMLLDMIGIDIAERVSKILYEAYGPRMAVPSLLSELIADGRLGRKSGTGIYRYDGQTDENLPKIIQRIREKTGRSAGSFTPERILLPMINEAAICLQEDVASPDDLDLAMVLGTGFPQEKGGPLHHADRVGLDGVLADLDRHTSEVGIRFWPAPIIKRMAGAGHVGLKSRRGFFSY